LRTCTIIVQVAKETNKGKTKTGLTEKKQEVGSEEYKKRDSWDIEKESRLYSCRRENERGGGCKNIKPRRVARL